MKFFKIKLKTLLATAVFAGVLSAQAFAYDGKQVTDHTLTIAFPTGWTSVDPVNNNAGIRDLSIVRSIYSALTQTDENGKLLPDIATEWTRTADNVWTFKLREDVIFPNGEKLDADNVVYNINRTLKEAEVPSNWITASISNITDVKVDDDYTVSITTKKSDLLLPQRLSGVFLASQKFAQDHDLKKLALGTGPYDLVSFKPDSEVVLKAKDQYYGGVAPYQNVRFVLASDSAAKVNGLKAGEIDAANIINPTDFKQLEASGKVVVGAIPSARVMLLAVNASQKPLDDKRVRQAISLAIDRAAITKFVFKGLVEPARDQNISEVYDTYNDDLGFSEFNPEKAKQLLAEAGLSNGFEVEYLTVQNSSIANDQIADLVAAQLGKIGIKVKLSIVPRSVGTERGGKAETAAGLTYSGFIDTAVVAAETLRYVGSTHAAVFTDVAEGYDQAVEDARSANSEEEKVAAIKKATQLAKDNQQAIYLWPLAQTFAHSKAVNWPIRHDDYLLPYTITPAIRAK